MKKPAEKKMNKKKAFQNGSQAPKFLKDRTIWALAGTAECVFQSRVPNTSLKCGSDVFFIFVSVEMY